jgi:hypothetical protein
MLPLQRTKSNATGVMAAIDEDNLSDGLFGSNCPGAWIIKIQQFAGQWQLDHILTGNGFWIVHHREDLKTGYMP